MTYGEENDMSKTLSCGHVTNGMTHNRDGQKVGWCSTCSDWLSVQPIIYMKRVGRDAYLPHSSSQAERQEKMSRDHDGWCRYCAAVVHPILMGIDGAPPEWVCPFHMFAGADELYMALETTDGSES